MAYMGATKVSKQYYPTRQLVDTMTEVYAVQFLWLTNPLSTMGQWCVVDSIQVIKKLKTAEGYD